MQDIATRSKVRFLYMSGVNPHYSCRYVVPRVYDTCIGIGVSGMYRKEMNLLRMTVEGNQWPFTLWFGRLRFPACAGHCLGIKGLSWGAIAVEVIVVCRRVFVHVRLVATHGDDVLFGVQRLPSLLE